VSADRLPDDQWQLVQSHLPIFCVDVVPVRRPEPRGGVELGLILRRTPDRGVRWCVIGGRLLIDETIADAATREIRSALGDSLTPSTDRQPPPLLVEYTRTRRTDGVYDLRQHSISATLPRWMSGDGAAVGPEALDFRWWRAEALTRELMGFGQESLVPRIVATTTGDRHG